MRTDSRVGDYVAASYWSIIELDTGIVCACMPSLRALVLRYFPKMFSNGTTKDSKGYTSSQRSDQKLSRNHGNADINTSDFIPLVDHESIRGKSAGADVRPLKPLDVWETRYYHIIMFRKTIVLYPDMAFHSFPHSIQALIAFFFSPFLCNTRLLATHPFIWILGKVLRSVRYAMQPWPKQIT